MPIDTARGTSWLPALRRYLVVMALGNLAWELAHMPLYRLWETAMPGEILSAALHCTAGDVLIASSTLLAALLLLGTGQWPERGYLPIAVPATAFGLAYTLVSEWLNVEVRGAWGYRDLMPIVPLVEVGLSPVMQWLVLPVLAFWLARPRKGDR